MYIMEIKICGFKICIKTIIISIILVMIVCYFTIFPYVKINTELFTNPSRKEYVMGNNVPMNKWTSSKKTDGIPERAMYSTLKDNIGGTFPLPEKKLSFFFDTPFNAECCSTPLKYTGSNGCVCMSSKQHEYLNSRGGNNSVSPFI